MSTCARVKAAARPPNRVEDELVGETKEVPGAAEFATRPRGAGALQNMPYIDGGGEDIEDRSEIIEGNGERGDGERGAIGDVTQDGGLGLEYRREIIEGNDERGATRDVT